MSEPMEKNINRTRILVLQEEIGKADRDIEHYTEQLERAKRLKKIMEKELEKESEGMTKEQREDLI